MTDKYFQFPSFVGSNLSHAQQRLEEAMEAKRAGRYDEALEQFIWLQRKLLELGSIISEAALREWIALARIHPKARTALDEMRHQKKQRVLADCAGLTDFDDLVAINKQLGCERETYELFLAIHKSFPFSACANAERAMPAIMSSGDFELALRYLRPQNIQILSGGLNSSMESLSLLKEPVPDLANGLIRGYISRVLLLLRALRGAGKFDEANEVRRLAVELIKSTEIREAVRTAIDAADGPE